MLVRVLAGLVEQDDLVDMGALEAAQLAPQRLGRADESAGKRAGEAFRVLALPLLVLVPEIDRARRRPLARRALAIEAQRELEEGNAVGAAPRRRGGLGAQEISGVRVGGI